MNKSFGFLFSQNLSLLLPLKEQDFTDFKNITKISLFVSFVFIVFGLFGNFFIVIMFAQKRFRINSSNVYLLCLAMNDSLFLIIHLFEVSKSIKSFFVDYILIA
jgi:hypothetical protein